MQKFEYMQSLKARGYHRCLICNGMGTTADRFSHRIDTCGQCNGVGMVKHQHRVASIVELERISVMRHWFEYHMQIFEQVRDWLLADGIPADEANQHAHRVVSTVPDVFKVAVEPGAVINTMRLDYIGDGTVTVHEGAEAHTTYGLWQYVDTSQGKKFFGLAHIPDALTGHLLVMRAGTETPLASYDPIDNVNK